MVIEFQAWPKTPRLFRDVIITEKIDGTNACVIVQEFPFGWFAHYKEPTNAALVLGPPSPEGGLPEFEYLVAAQSRKRVITPESDNFGFAAWVYENADFLAQKLGEGYHYGEWWGRGIQRGYGLDHKRFSLFNAHRWGYLANEPATRERGLDVVPVLYEGIFSEAKVKQCDRLLRTHGSEAAPGYMDPEGLIVFHTASRQCYKYLVECDEIPKSLREAA